MTGQKLKVATQTLSPNPNPKCFDFVQVVALEAHTGCVDAYTGISQLCMAHQ